jgi:hypothetical protein
MAKVRTSSEVSNGYIGYDGPDLPYSQQGPLKDNPSNPGTGTSNGVADPNDPTGGVLPEYTGGTVPGAQLPSSQKRDQVGGAFKGRIDAAKKYLANMKATGDAAYATYQNQSRRKLAGSIKGVKNDFNSRGLLNSGLQGDAVAGTTAAVNSDLINKRAEINQGLLGNQAQLEGNAYDLASVMAQRGPSTADAYLSGIGSNIALQSADSALASQMYGQIGAGVGAIGGSALAGQMGGGGGGYNPVEGVKPKSGYYDFNKMQGNGRQYA